MVYNIHEEWALLQINVTENRNCLATSSESPPMPDFGKNLSAGLDTDTKVMNRWTDRQTDRHNLHRKGFFPCFFFYFCF
jgi:hypothetical protein